MSVRFLARHFRNIPMRTISDKRWRILTCAQLLLILDIIKNVAEEAVEQWCTKVNWTVEQWAFVFWCDISEIFNADERKAAVSTIHGKVPCRLVSRCGFFTHRLTPLHRHHWIFYVDSWTQWTISNSPVHFRQFNSDSPVQILKWIETTC